MKLKLFFLLLLTLLIVNSSLLIGTVRYVSKTGTSTPPFLSWNDAADSIQKCINICVDGDTIYVANGVYYESIYIDKTINLWGSSADSTIIDGTGTPNNYIIYFFENNSSMKNFKLTSPSTPKTGLASFKANLWMENCIIVNIYLPVSIANSSVLLERFILYDFSNYGIRDECPNDTCKSKYSENILFTNSGSTAVYFSYGGTPTFINNIVHEEGNTVRGVDIQYHRGAVVKNNLISGYRQINLRAGEIRTDTAYFENNNSLNSSTGTGIATSTAHRTIIRNNIIKDNYTGINSLNGSTIPNYNLFWNNNTNITGTAIPGSKNINASPMFVKDSIPNSSFNFDHHLQAYSPAIDDGDPNILDKDGTRSDIGMYGGPFGETYTYQDLAPLAPRNLSAVVDTDSILVKWNRNTEADTAFYKVYRDTVINFTIDSTKLISTQTDTFFVHLSPFNSSKYVYKITCVDNQGNESKPSIELVVNITSVSTNEYPMTISDYILYQNYPNPFNPSTKIGYQLKERAYVKLMVYDIKGELVSVLVNKEQTAGYYEVEFSSSGIQNQKSSIKGIASGIYLYRIEVISEGNIPIYSDLKKMLLIK